MKYQYFLHYRPDGEIVTHTMYTTPQFITVVAVAEGCRVVGIEVDHPAIFEPEQWQVRNGKVGKRP